MEAVVPEGFYFAIEASGPVLSVAMCRISAERECSILYSATGTDANQHAEELPYLFSGALEESNVSVEGVRGVFVGEGPGSFTGLRIGVSFAQGLCFSTGHLFLAPTFSALASASAPSLRKRTLYHPIVVAGDARRGEVFAAGFTGVGATLKEEVPLAIWETSQFLSELKSVNATELAFIARDKGESTRHLQVLLESEYRVHIRTPHEASALCFWVSQGALVQQFSTPSEHACAAPRYMRKVAARTIAERSST